MGQILHGTATMTERLSWRPSTLLAPWREIPYDSARDGEQLSQDSNECNLLWPSAGDEPVVESAKTGLRRIMARGLGMAPTSPVLTASVRQTL
jgi:hypothetical protein